MNDITTIMISGKLSYTDEITIKQATQIIAYLNSEDGETLIVRKDPISQDDKSQFSTKQVGNSREAISVSGAKTNPEKIVALGAYILRNGEETFRIEDVKTQFRSAREATPTNISRDLSAAIASGWITEGEGGELYLTAKVDTIFDGGFVFGTPAITNRARSRPKRNGLGNKSSKPESLSSIDEFPTTMDGLKSYGKMKQNKDKLLWALMFAKSHGISGLQNKDVTWLTDHLGDGLPSKQVTAAFASAQRAGHANRSTQENTMRITGSGEIYLAEAE